MKKILILLIVLQGACNLSDETPVIGGEQKNNSPIQDTGRDLTQDTQTKKDQGGSRLDLGEDGSTNMDMGQVDQDG